MAVGGCTGSASQDPAGGTLADGEKAGVTVSDVERERSQADPSQLAILDSGKEITFADYRAAVARSVACIRDAGIDVVGDDRIDRSRGFPMIAYSFSGSSEGRTDDATLAVADACVAKYSLLVEGEYQTQPTSVEAIEAEFTKRKPAIITCLHGIGSGIDASATRSEIALEVREVAASQGTDCFAEAGFAG